MHVLTWINGVCLGLGFIVGLMAGIWLTSSTLKDFMRQYERDER